MSTDIANNPEYRAADRALRLRNLKIGFLLTLFFVPAGNCLEWFVYPQHITEFLLTRLLFDVFQLPLFVLLFFPIAKRHIKLLCHIWPLIPVVMVSWLIYRSEGSVSPYYAGLNLMVIVACFLIPFTWLESLFYCTMTLLTYVAACVAHDQTQVDWMLLLNNLYFISVTGVICVVACYFLTLKRQEDFRLRHELAKRNDQLAELDRIKSDFFANISHEFRTPLTLILAPVQELLNRKDSLPQPTHQTLELVKHNANRLLKLINDLLEVIRLQNKTIKLESRPLNITAMVKGLVQSVQHLAQAKEVTLELNCNVDQAIVLGDWDRLEKVFLNLLTNAIKFTTQGDSITVELTSDQQTVTINIIDTGIGIAEKDLSQIFDRFKQVDSSSTRRFQGLGLGLAMSRELVQEHEGELHVTSKMGEQTCFTVSLPLTQTDTQTPIQQSGDETDNIVKMMRDAQHATTGLASESTQAIAETGQGEYRILVVDDEPEMRSFLATTLSEDYRVLQATDGNTGLAIAQEQQPDLVLLDLMMPGINGLDVCEKLRQNPQLTDMKIVLLTARADEQSKLDALNRGADDFLTKPFGTLELRTRLGNLLKTASLQKDLRQRHEQLQKTMAQLQATEAQLIQSKKMNALGSLAAGLLHEINNPLNYTLMALQMLQESLGDLGQDDQQTLADIHQGMKRIGEIVSDLRSFAYPEQSQVGAQCFAADALTMALRFTAHDRGEITINVQMPKALQVRCSRSQLTQVLVNLLQNAIAAVKKAPKDRQPVIDINGQLTNDTIEITMQDNGIGIAPEKLPKIFDPFFTTHEVGANSMGLGLSICHAIVEKMGGTISIESQPDQWTKVTMSLPAINQG
ncbi:MAG: ATP-binding protein [Phycisphaeraceae bacterium JB051]